MVTTTPTEPANKRMKQSAIKRSDAHSSDGRTSVNTTDAVGIKQIPKRHARKGEVFNRKRAYVERDKQKREKPYPPVSVSIEENLRFYDLVMELAEDMKVNKDTGFMKSVTIVGEFEGDSDGPSIIEALRTRYENWMTESTKDKQSEHEELSGPPHVSAGPFSDGSLFPTSNLRAEDSAAHIESQHTLPSPDTPVQAPIPDDEKIMQEKQKRLASELAYAHDFAKGKSPLRCAYCQKCFLNKPTWSGHLKSCAASICKVCDKSFSGHPKRHREHADHIKKVTALKAEIQGALQATAQDTFD